MKFFNLLILPSFLVLTACQQLPVEQQPLAIVQEIDNDSDQDGVLDDKDQCPNTLLNVVVDEKGCPKPYATDLDMINNIEMRVFYNKNEVFPSERYLIGDIAKVGKKLKEYPNAYIILEGHASKVENDKDSKGISRERVLVIKQLLKEKYGIADDRIITESYGDARPIADNATEEGRNMNQRVYGVITGKK